MKKRLLIIILCFIIFNLNIMSNEIIWQKKIYHKIRHFLEIDKNGDLWYISEYADNYEKILKISRDGKILLDIDNSDNKFKNFYSLKLYNKEYFYEVINDLDLNKYMKMRDEDIKNKVPWTESIKKWPEKINNWLVVYDLNLNEVKRIKLDYVLSCDYLAGGDPEEGKAIISKGYPIKKIERGLRIFDFSVLNKKMWLVGKAPVYENQEIPYWNLSLYCIVIDENFNIIDKNEYESGLYETIPLNKFRTNFDSLDVIAQNKNTYT